MLMDKKPTTIRQAPRSERLMHAASLGRVIEPMAQRMTGRQLTALGRLKRDWPLIAGAATAAACRPEALRFPRDRSDGATLTLLVRPGDALDLSYRLPRLVERINAHFGFAALAAIKLTQGEWAEAKPFRPPPPGRLSVDERTALDRIEDPELRATLTRIGQSIAGEGALPASRRRSMPKPSPSTETDT